MSKSARRRAPAAAAPAPATAGDTLTLTGTGFPAAPPAADGRFDAVVTVTLGYASNFVAGTLALAYIALGIATPLLATKVGPTHDLTLGRALTKMVYAIVCFATLFSFVGTVLGGIWADQSWGRFWGWDPKENGALMIVLWNAAALHARWDRWLGPRGFALFAIGGNIITAWSWFGFRHAFCFKAVGMNWFGSS
jgi:ABC-type transport system involved in cytochrome c biogenesis permease subunit